jgi:hypothetical protein
MVLALQIEKDNKEDCPHSCPFRSDCGDREECTLFNKVLDRDGYYDSYSTVACYKCQNLFENQKTVAQQTNGVED